MDAAVDGPVSEDAMSDTQPEGGGGAGGASLDGTAGVGAVSAGGAGGGGAGGNGQTAPTPPMTTSGCSCAAVGTAPAATWMVLLLGCLLLLARRTRRRGR
jgi:MYXO-CTERM domain-containing protein